MGINPSPGEGGDFRSIFCPGVRSIYYAYDWDMPPYRHIFYSYSSEWSSSAETDQHGERLSAAERPGDTFLIMDGTGRTLYTNIGQFGDWFMSRHGGKVSGRYNEVEEGAVANICFADGHVQFWTYGEDPIATAQDKAYYQSLDK